MGRYPNILEISKTGLENVLKFRSRETFPEQWAATLNNLAYVYSNRIFGDKAENLERAINYYKSALEVINSETFPEQRAITLNNLAIAYTQRIKGSRKENLDKAIASFQKYLRIYTKGMRSLLSIKF